MANQVEKVTGIAIASIEKINSRTDDNIEKISGREFTGSLPGLIDLTYSGLTWTASTVIAANNYGGSHIGTATAGGVIIADRETLQEWNGTGTTGSWSTEDSMSGKHSAAGSGGTQTAGVIFGGYNSTAGAGTDVTEEYDGSSFSTAGSMDMVSGTTGGSGGGNVQTNQIATGGSTYSPTVRDIASTELYNGSTWSDAGDDSNGLSGSACVGTTNFVKISGSFDASGIQEACEYFTLSTTTWSSIANLSNKTRYNKCWGDETRAFTCGGYGRDDYGAPIYYSYHDKCDMWTDNSWASQTALPVAHGGLGVGGSDGGTNVGGGWTTGGDSGQGNSYTNLTSHYIAVAS